MRMSWAWIGGFFEGEGCVTWYKGKPKGHAGRGAVITIGQKEKAPLVLIQQFLRKHQIDARIYWRKPYKSKYRKSGITGIWAFQITRKADTDRFLRKVIPYLIEKRLKATIVLERLTLQRQSKSVDVAKAVNLREGGMPIHKIARLMGFGYRKVRDALEKAGKHTGRLAPRSTQNATKQSGQMEFWC